MKKLISFALMLALCLSLFAGCGIFSLFTPDPSESLMAAQEFLDSYMKDFSAETTMSFDVLGVVAIDGNIFPVEWTVDNAAITLEKDEENGLVKVVIPGCGDVAVPYTLTATLSEDSGAKLTSTYNFTVPVADYVLSTPQTGVAYKLGLYSTAKKKAYYFTGAMKGFFGDTSTTFSDAIDVTLEETNGGYYLTFTVDGAKKYIGTVYELSASDNKYHLNFVIRDTATSVFTFDTKLSTFATTVEIDEVETVCYIGTSGNYYTFDSITADKVGEDTYLAHLYVKDVNGEEPKPNVPNNDPTPDTELSIPDAFALGQSKNHDTYTAGKYYVTGVIKEVTKAQYGNMIIEDAEGNALTIYGSYGKDGNGKFSEMNPVPKAGDTVKLYGIIGQFNGTPQMKNAWIQEHTPASGDNTGDDNTGDDNTGDDGVMSIPEVLASAEGTAVVVKGTVSEIYQSWSDPHSNISFYISDEAGNKLLVFRTGTKVTVGDKVTVTGKATVYSGTIQIAQGGTTVIDEAHVCSTFTEGSCTIDSVCTVCGAVGTAAPGHNYVDGFCSCGAAEPVGDVLPGNLTFTSAANKASADDYLKENFPEWKITGKLGKTYGGYLGFGRDGDSKSAITSSAISVSNAFTVTTVLKGNGSNGVVTSTLTFTLIDAEGNTIATGYANGSTTAAITPADGKDTTYSISFTFADGKTWTDVSNLVVSFVKATGNIGLKSLDFVQ